MKIPLLVRCNSHRFILAVSDILSEHEDAFAAFRKPLLKLRHLAPAAKLRRLTDLKARVDNVTLWSSSFQMLVR